MTLGAEQSFRPAKAGQFLHQHYRLGLSSGGWNGVPRWKCSRSQSVRNLKLLGDVASCSWDLKVKYACKTRPIKYPTWSKARSPNTISEIEATPCPVAIPNPTVMAPTSNIAGARTNILKRSPRAAPTAGAEASRRSSYALFTESEVLTVCFYKQLKNKLFPPVCLTLWQLFPAKSSVMFDRTSDFCNATPREICASCRRGAFLFVLHRLIKMTRAGTALRRADRKIRRGEHEHALRNDRRVGARTAVARSPS
jgi:hypothetical protein